jgi:hypothetical protein
MKNPEYFILLIICAIFGFLAGVIANDSYRSDKNPKNTTSAEQLCKNNLKSEVSSLHFEKNKIVILCEKVKN